MAIDSRYKLKTGEEVDYFPPIQNTANPYATEAAMYADQVNQLQGYGYLVDGVGAFIYLGTTAGTAADYRPFIEIVIKSKIPFITKWNVVTGETITLPVGTEGINEIKVDWGDGTINTEHSHTYTTGGVKTISIIGVLEDFRFDVNSISRLNLTEVVQWGDTEWVNIAFTKCENLVSIPSTESPDFRRCTSLYRFLAWTGLTTGYKATFKYTHQVISINSLMYNSPINSLEDGIFDNLINTVNGDYLLGSTNLTTLPALLFKNNSKLTSLIHLCINVPITSIPEDLFIGATSLRNISAGFRETGITSLPKKLFWSCTELRDVSQMLYGISGDTLDKDIFKYSKKIENFNEFCRNQGTWLQPVPPIWMDFPNAIGTDAFSLGIFPNVSEIPVEWGGNNVDWINGKGTVNKTWTGSQYDYDNVLPQAWKDDTTILKFII